MPKWVAERGHAQDIAGCNEQSAAHATQYVAKAGIELRGIRDGVLALTDMNLNPAANTGEPKVLKTVEFPQVQYVDEIVDEPVAILGQVPTTQTVQKTVEVSQVQFSDRVTDVPVVSRRHVPGQSIREEIVEAIRVVDSEDLPLNIYREILLENKILRVIKKEYVTKCLDTLAEIAELDDAYKRFHEQLVKCRKLGIYEDSTVGVKTAEVLRFNTSKPGFSFDGHVDHMKEGQNDISYITGESIAVVSSLFEENLHKKGHEVPYMADPVDECAVHQFKEFGGKMLNPTLKEGLNLGDDEKKKTLEEELKANLEPSKKLMKDVLGDKVEMVITSDRIVDSPCVPTTSEYEYGWSAKMKRIVEAQALRDDSMTSHMVSKKTMEVNPRHSTARSLEPKSRQDLHGHRQQQQDQLTKQSVQQEREEGKKEKSEKVERKEWETVVAKGRKGQRERGQEGTRKEEEREPEEEECKQVKKVVTDWTVVTRNKRQKKMVQIFVRVNGSKSTSMEVNLTDDKVEDVMRRIQNVEDTYVTLHGRVLKKSEKLKSCGVTDGCTIQVTNRMRGGGRHKVKKSKESTKTERMEHRVDRKDDEVEGVAMDSAQPMGEGSEQRWADEVKSDKGPAIRECDKDACIQMVEQTEVYRKIVDKMSGGNDFEVELMVQEYMRMSRETLGWTQEQVEMLGCGIRWAIEARKKGRGTEKERRRREEPLEETRAESTDELEVTSRVVEVKTGRGSASLVQGGVDGHDELDETRGKGKGKGNGGEGEHGGKGDKGGKGIQLKREEEQETAEEDEGRVRVAPNMGAGGSHPQAMTNPEEKQRQGGQWVLRPMRKWADCVDEEPEEEAEEEDKHEAEDESEAGGRSSKERVTEEEAEGRRE